MNQILHRIVRLVFGTLDRRRIIIIIMPGIIVGGVVLQLHDAAAWQRVIAVFLTIDLVAGAISNATPQTNAAWRRVARWYRLLFVIVHVCVYPLVLGQLMLSHELYWSMITILVIKLLFFVRGTRVDVSTNE